MSETKKPIKRIAENKKARHNYTISEKLEAGISLVGSEVKSLRAGGVNMKDSYASITEKGEVFLHQLHISPYPFAYYGNHDPERPRKLLLHKHEIKRLKGKVSEKGYSLVPLGVYFKGRHVKVRIGLGKGKNLYDKRQSIKERDMKLEMNRINKFKDY